MPSNALKTLVKNQEEDAKELIDTLSKKGWWLYDTNRKINKRTKRKAS